MRNAPLRDTIRVQKKTNIKKRGVNPSQPFGFFTGKIKQM